MSNRLHIVSTVFTNKANGAVSYGYRIFDDYEQKYVNHWPSAPKDDFELLQHVVEEDDSDNMPMIDHHLRHNPRGMYINDCWYDYTELVPLIAAWQGEESAYADDPPDSQDDDL